MFLGTTIFNGDCNGNAVLVRYPKASDCKKLLEFINNASKEQTYILLQGEQLSMEDEVKYIEGFNQKIEDKKAVKLLAFHKDELIGVADIYLKDKVERHVGVFGIIVVPMWRAKGVGTLLLTLTLQEAEKHMPNLKIVTLGVFGNNQIAKKLYEKMGFVEYGRLEGGIEHKGELVDHIYMFKKIGNGTG